MHFAKCHLGHNEGRKVQFSTTNDDDDDDNEEAFKETKVFFLTATWLIPDKNCASGAQRLPQCEFFDTYCLEP